MLKTSREKNTDYLQRVTVTLKTDAAGQKREARRQENNIVDRLKKVPVRLEFYNKKKNLSRI